MTIEVLDPTSERTAGTRPLASRLKTLDGKTVALLDIRKPLGDAFLDRTAELLAQHGATVLRFTKPTFTKPAPIDLRQRIATECDAVIEALAD